MERAVKEEKELVPVEPTKPKKNKLLLLIFGFFLIFIISTVLAFISWSKPPVGKTSFLILGVTGENFIGGDLTDTIMYATVNNQTGHVAIVSFPRDIWIENLKTKLNSVYHYGQMPMAKQQVGEIVGQPIDYAVVVDSNLFIKIVDYLGGLDLRVEISFEDFKYPIPGKENDLCNGDREYRCRYEHLVFNSGWQHMDGARALKYVRSRNAVGDEGTDFARNERQQNFLLALKNKLISWDMASHPRKIQGLIDLVLGNVKTDFGQEKYLDLLKTGLRFRSNKIRMGMIGENFLTNPKNTRPFNNQWVLVAKENNWLRVQEYVRCLESDGLCQN